ncbi:hypothetical protein [Deinococcus maricopensis]|uniref:5-bromo-4-chloroindolyl phosphate hydrolysis protein n=1 Tax=Deinococcus maricopensis (strain DSM 21211 / LMG 22137 / NRRL B-23946 / LB-34) TaxID=709986 RepID=E8U4T2_DEIML|nr:hypothetical protein [Deinococcus maricopensis]ADV66071.1 hypothetical protein Deima_0411 [Deinococcus maricopensis DSM 21211]
MYKPILTTAGTAVASAAALGVALAVHSTLLWTVLALVFSVLYVRQTFVHAQARQALERAQPPALFGATQAGDRATPALGAASPQRSAAPAQPVPEQLSTRTGEIIHRHRDRLEENILQRVHIIMKRLEAVDKLLAGNNLTPEQAHVARKMATEYLPEALENYLRIPPALAKTKHLTPGKTAYDILVEQLSTLGRAAKQLQDEATTSEAQNLLANHNFLQAKFKQASTDFDT